MMQQELYQKILEIEQPEDQPFHHYILLDIKLFEADGKVIHRAGLTQIKKLKQWQLHPEPDIQKAVQDMLNRISLACSILEVPEKKEEYDKTLAEQLNIDLAQDKSYRILTHETELMVCPNCQARVSKLSILCIDCGYNFQTGQVIKTVIENAPTAYSGHTYSEQQTKINPLLLPFQFILANLKLVLIPIILLIIAGVAFGVWYFLKPDSRYVCEGEFTRKKDWHKNLKQSELWQIILDNQSSTPGVRFIVKETVEHARRRTHKIDIKVMDNDTNKQMAVGHYEYIRYTDFDDRFNNEFKRIAVPALTYTADEKPELYQLYQDNVEENNEYAPIYLTALSKSKYQREKLKQLVLSRLPSNNSDAIRQTALMVAIEQKLDESKMRKAIMPLLKEKDLKPELEFLVKDYYNKLILPDKSLRIKAKVYSSGKRTYSTLTFKVRLAKNHKVSATLLTGQDKHFSGTWSANDNGNILIHLPGYYRLSFNGSIKSNLSGFSGTGSLRKKILPRGFYYRGRNNYESIAVDWTSSFIKTTETEVSEEDELLKEAEEELDEEAEKEEKETDEKPKVKIDKTPIQDVSVKKDAMTADVDKMVTTVLEYFADTDPPSKSKLDQFEDELTSLYRKCRKTDHDELTQLLKSNRYLILNVKSNSKKYISELINSYESLHAVKSGNNPLTDKTLFQIKKTLKPVYIKVLTPLIDREKTLDREIRIIEKQLKSSHYSVKQLSITTKKELNPLYKYKRKLKSRSRRSNRLEKTKTVNSSNEKYITAYYVSVNGGVKRKMSEQQAEFYKKRYNRYKILEAKLKKLEKELEQLQDNIANIKEKFTVMK